MAHATAIPPFQFGLRGMLLLMALVACGFGLGLFFAIFVTVMYAMCLLFARGQKGWAIGTLAAMLVLTIAGVGVLVEIRLDTGDRRLVVWGIPVFVHRMAPEARASLLSIQDRKEPVRWCWCATEVGSNHPDAMVRRMYRTAAVWAKADPAVARAIVGDLGSYLKSTHGMYGLPDSCHMLGPPVIILGAKADRIAVGWERLPEVQGYLKKNGIRPVSTTKN